MGENAIYTIRHTVSQEPPYRRADRDTRAATDPTCDGTTGRAGALRTAGAHAAEGERLAVDGALGRLTRGALDASAESTASAQATRLTTKLNSRSRNGHSKSCSAVNV